MRNREVNKSETLTSQGRVWRLEGKEGGEGGLKKNARTRVYISVIRLCKAKQIPVRKARNPNSEKAIQGILFR